MSNNRELAEYIRGRIAGVCARPKMFGMTAASVAAALYCYHDIWSRVEGREQELRSVHEKVLQDENCGCYNFEAHYMFNLSVGGDYSEDSAIEYVIRQWRRIDELLGLEHPTGRKAGE